MQNRPQLISNINITPFVDVLLVLLVIFMATLQNSVSLLLVDLPKVESSRITEQRMNNQIVLSIKKNGDIYVNELLLKRKNIINQIKSLTVNYKDQRILIYGDQESSYGTIAEVISDLSQAGFRKIGLVTQNLGS